MEVEESVSPSVLGLWFHWNEEGGCGRWGGSASASSPAERWGGKVGREC